MKNYTLLKKVVSHVSIPLFKKLLLCYVVLFSGISTGVSQNLPVKGIVAIGFSATAVSNISDPVYSSFTVVFSQQPQAAVVCEGGDTSFTVVASGGAPLTYQWQVSTNGGALWNNVSDNSTYSGSATATLFINDAPFSLNTFQYRCNVSDGVTNTSNEVLLTVNPLPVVQTGNVSATICANGGGTLTATVYPNTSYQWEVSTDMGGNWANVTDGLSYSGSATDALVISNAQTLDGYLYRYAATNTITGCSATSTGVDTLHVTYINTTATPAATTITCAGTNTSLSVTANGNGTLGYQWRLFPSNANVTNNATYSGATSATLSITNPAIGLNNTRYTVVINNNGTCPVVLGPYTLQVRAVTAINTQPQNASTCATGNASFSVSAVGNGLTYQWQTDNGTSGTTWANVATGNPLNLSNVTMTMNGYRYRVNVNGNCGNVVSSEVTLTVRSSGTWLGAVDTNWHVPGNWCGGVPVSTTDVLIPNWAPRMPTISNTTGTAYFQSLTIENTARLEINGGVIDNMSGPFSILGTVAYTASADQQVFPAPHGSLEINGSGNKSLLTNVNIAHNLVLGGTAKLVTGSSVLTMLNGSNPISGAAFNSAATSWIVTGNGNSGAANTGLGGLRIEQLNASDGTVLYPVGPTSASYNPIELTNSGVADNFTIAVNDQRIPGSLFEFGINRTWLVNESTPGGSNIALTMRWSGDAEQSHFVRAISEVVRSNGSIIVENSATAAASGSNPYSRGNGSFTSLTQFSVSSYLIALPVKVITFAGKLINTTATELTWKSPTGFIAQTYIIQKSTDGIHYANIGEVKGNAGVTDYQFTDNSFSSMAWYRLQMIGDAGETAFSKVIQVNSRDKETQVELRPSVVHDQTSLFIVAEKNDDLLLVVYDAAGRVHLKRTLHTQKGKQNIVLNTAPLKKGSYYLHITGAGGMKKILSMLKQ